AGRRSTGTDRAGRSRTTAPPHTVRAPRAAAGRRGCAAPAPRAMTPAECGGRRRREVREQAAVAGRGDVGCGRREEGSAAIPAAPARAVSGAGPMSATTHDDLDHLAVT